MTKLFGVVKIGENKMVFIDPYTLRATDCVCEEESVLISAQVEVII